MSRGALAERGPAIRLRTLSFAALGTAAVVTGVAVVPDLVGPDDDALPSDVGDDAPRDFTITYRVEAGDVVTTEQLVVHRPFSARLTTRAGDGDDGEVLSERASAFGVLATSSRGGPWARLTVPPSIASADLRPDAMLAEAVDAGLLEAQGRGSIGGRACRLYRAGTSMAGGTLEPLADDEHADVCIDEQGFVLEERWFIDDELVRSRRAVDLSFDAVPDDAVAVPDGDEMDGSGELEPVAAGGTSPFPQALDLAEVPDGFEADGRYAVVAPRLGVTPGTTVPTNPDVASLTDVWVRGSDVLILDQGASRGRDPFPPTEIERPLALPGLTDDCDGCSATLVIDARASEVRIRLADGGFARLSGTLPPEVLRDLARTLTFHREDDDG